jgi:hypothetical protein
MASGIALKFQGSKFYVETGLDGGSPTVAITAISQADPGVVTATAHGKQDGQPVYIYGVVGMTEVNGGRFIVQNATGSTFELADTDTSGYTAYVSGGSIDEPSFGNWCELTGYNAAGGSAPEIDTTTICSVAAENVLGLPDRGTLTLDFNFAPNTNIQTILRASQSAGTVLTYRLLLPEPSTNGIVTFFGRVQSLSFQGAVGGKHTGSVTIRLTGDIYVSTV